MARHRTHYKGYLNGKSLHIRSYDLFDEFGIENCKIELIEYFKCIAGRTKNINKTIRIE